MRFPTLTATALALLATQAATAPVPIPDPGAILTPDNNNNHILFPRTPEPTPNFVTFIMKNYVKPKSPKAAQQAAAKQAAGANAFSQSMTKQFGPLMPGGKKIFGRTD